MAGNSLTWRSQTFPASELEICAFEKRLGLRFPDDYREFVQKFGGGTPIECCFEFLDAELGTFHAGVGMFLSPVAEGERSIATWMTMTEEFPRRLVPISLDGGGNHLCLDYRSREIPVIGYWHHERRGVSDEISFVASTFSELIGLLHLPPDDED